MEPDGPGTFQTLQSTPTSSHRARPPPVKTWTEDGDETRLPLKAGKLQRTGSKGGLRAMFTRNKIEKDAMAAVLEEPLPDRRPSEVKSIAGRSLYRNDSAKNVVELTPITPAKPTAKPSRMNLRSRSVKESKQLPKPTKSNPKSVTPRSPAAWDPPPLFQAYPQAIKHAQLSASILSADSIIRVSNHRRNNSLRDGMIQDQSNSAGQDQATTKKAVKAKNKHRRELSGSILKAEWTQKIFVLVTSGYLLQYSGEGPFDRLPEKMLQLGKDSVAFASDVIPGKHWVLQISQSMDADGIPTADSRSLLSRLTFRGAEYRRTATSFLLVLNSAEEMDSWISVVRREIESLGGKKHLPETGKDKPDDRVVELKAQPSHRNLAQMNLDEFPNPSSPVSPMSPSFGPPPWKVEYDTQPRVGDSATAVLQPSISNQVVDHHQFTSNITMSHDPRQGENLRENANRLSYMSSGQRTLVTSPGSSAASSPTRESMSTYEELPAKVSSEDVRPRLNSCSLKERRRSMQALQIQTLDATSKTFRHSTYGVPNRSPRNYSFPKPNLNGPASPGKRHPTTEEPPPLPPIVTTTPRKTMLKGIRKAPPAALNVSRPQSAGSGGLTPKSAPPVLLPTASTSRMLQPTKPSIVNIPAKLSNPATPIEIVYPQRRSSLMAKEENYCLRRNASMLALQAATNTILEVPSRPPPLPPAALIIPLPASPLYPNYETGDLQAAIDTALESASQSITPRHSTESNRKQRRPISTHNTSIGLSPTTDTPPPLPKPTKSPRLSPSRPSFQVSVRDPSNHIVSQTSVSPSIERLKPQSSPSLVNRRSMPMLVNSLPPMPPPNYALPPLPPGTTPRSAVVSRESVRVRA
jgi:hypothetical protein